MAQLMSGGGVSIAYTLETSDQTLGGTNQRGTEPGTPSTKLWPTTGRDINPQRALIRPNEISSQGMRILGEQGFETIAGNPGFDLAMEDFDEQIGWALMSDWTANTTDTTATSIDSAISGSTFTGTGLFTNFAIGDVVEASGFSAAVDGIYLVTAATANSITVLPTIPADVTGGGDEQVVKPGASATRPANADPIGMTIERWFSGGVTPFGQVFNGCCPASLAFNLGPGGVSTVSSSLIGIQSRRVTTRIDATPTAAAGNPKLKTLHGRVVLNGAESAVVTALQFTLNQGNTTGEAVIGSRYTPDIFGGESFIEGQIEFYVADKSILDLWDAETVFPLWVMTRPSAGSTDFHSVYLPRAKILTPPINPPQQGPIKINATFEAGYDSTLGSSIVYQVSNVPA